MADEIRIYKHKDGSTTMVNVTAINELIHELAVEEAMQILSHFGETPSFLLGKEINDMEKKRKSKIRKWDEVTGATEIEVDEITADATEEAGAGPSISKNPMRGIEDMVEQNDNNFDGVINNLPEPKPVAQVTNEDVIEAEQKKKSVLEKIREAMLEPEKVKSVGLCPDRELC